MATTEQAFTRSTTRPSKRSLAFALAAFILAGFFVVRNLSTWRTRLIYPGDESYEGCALAEIVRLRQGVPLYAPPTANAFAGATYGPLYYLLGSGLLNPDNPSYLPL